MSTKSSERSARSSPLRKVFRVRLSDEHRVPIPPTRSPNPPATEPSHARTDMHAAGPLTEYDKKKYVWKLLYIYMLGYPVEFGHKQASDLIAAPK